MADDVFGLGPPPTAPAMPPPTGRDPGRAGQIMRLIAMGLAGGLGPGVGTGIAQGLNLDTERRRRDSYLQDEENRRRFDLEQRTYESQAQAYELEQRRRQQTLQQNIMRLQELAPTLKSKDEYDRYVQTFAGGLQSMGYRLDANFLRSAAPYVAPTAKDTAGRALDAFFKNPMNKSLLDNPEALGGAFIQFDRDGDGVPERVAIPDVAAIAQMPLGEDASGKPLLFPKGTSPDAKANADGILQSLLAQDRAEGKADTPQRRVELQKQAIKQAKEAGDLGPDPLVQAIREQTLAGLQTRGSGFDLNHRFSAEEQLAKTWTGANQASREVQRQFALMQTGLKRFRAGDKNGGSQAVLVTFQKILDPTSVVRESEYARTAAGQSFLNRLDGYQQRLAQGGAGMTDGELAAMVETARQFMDAMQSFTAVERRRIETQIGQYGLNPASVFGDISDAVPDEGPPAPGVDTSSARAKYRAREGRP
jgi:hypothetical protein